MSKGGGNINQNRKLSQATERDIRLGLMPAARSVFNSQSGNAITPAMDTALSGLEGAAARGSPIGDAGQSYIESLLAGGAGSSNPALAEMSRIATGGDIGANPYLDAAYDRAAGAVTRNFNESVVPGLDAAFADAGRTGSGQYALLRNRAEENLGTALGDMATGLYGNAYESDRNRQMSALGSLNSSALGGIGLGGNVQAQQTQPYLTALGAAQTRQNQEWAPVQQYADILGPLLGNAAPTQQASRNVLADALTGGLSTAGLASTAGASGGLLGGLGLLGGVAGLLSDARAKTDIKRVGQTDDGLGVYTYRYKGGKGIHMGVMAQEVVVKQPEAVTMRPDGLMAVFYDKVH